MYSRYADKRDHSTRRVTGSTCSGQFTDFHRERSHWNTRVHNWRVSSVMFSSCAVNMPKYSDRSEITKVPSTDIEYYRVVRQISVNVPMETSRFRRQPSRTRKHSAVGDLLFHITELNWLHYYAPRHRGGGIKLYRDPPVCLSQGAAAIGYRHTRVQIAAATLSGNSLRQTVHTHRASVHQAAKLVAALLRVAMVTAGLAESNDSLPPGL